MYMSMAHTVGKILHIRPSEILDTWGVPELIVAYGFYTDEISSENYENWKNLDSQARQKVEKPHEYHVKFYGLDKIGNVK